MAREFEQIVALMWFIGSTESEFGNDHPLLLVENIRKQLMNDNYDYMPTESKEMFPIKHELSNQETTVKNTTDYGDRINSTDGLDSSINDHFISQANKTKDNDLDSNINDIFIPKQKSVETKDDFKPDNNHAMSRRNLLHNVGDARLKHNAIENAVDKLTDDTTQTTVDTTTTTTIFETTSPKVKYKVLKVKQSHPNRRSQTFRRFIQEEGDNGVVIINLDDKPFPEFRLPRTRRQYMMGQDDFDSGMEIAPLSSKEGGERREDYLGTDKLDRMT